MKFEDVKKAHQIYKTKVSKGLWISLSITILLTLGLVATNSLGSHPVTGLIIGLFFSSFFVGIFALIFILIFTRKQADAYRKAYKAYFVEQNLRKTFTNLSYDHAAGIASSVLRATEMVNTGDRYASNDLTTGKYKNVAFTQADVHIENEYTDSDGNTNYVTIFKGRFMIFEFPKKFNFRLEVVEKGFGANRIPGKNRQTGRKFEKISLESNEFNKIFKTYAEDGFEAFYLLDPDFINNILELAEEHKGKLLLGFLDNKLLIGLKDGKDAFEPPNVFKKLDENTETTKIANEIHLITNFVDQLKLDHKLFK